MEEEEGDYKMSLFKKNIDFYKKYDIILLVIITNKGNFYEKKKKKRINT